MNTEYTDEFNDEEDGEEEGEREGKLSKKQQAILWRRAKVMDLYMTGHSMTSISDTLKVSLSLISKDIAFIRQQSQEQLKSVVTNELPLQWSKTRAALQFIQRQALDVFHTAKADSIKLAALSLFSDAHQQEFALVANSEVIDQTIKFVTANKDKEKDTGVIPKHSTNTKEKTRS